MDYLRRANWDVDKACDMYFADPANQSASQVKPKPTKKQEELFAKYKGSLWKFLLRLEKTEDKIGMDGIQEFLNDLKVDPLDPVTLVFSYMCKAKTMVSSENEYMIS